VMAQLALLLHGIRDRQHDGARAAGRVGVADRRADSRPGRRGAIAPVHRPEVGALLEASVQVTVTPRLVACVLQVKLATGRC